ncbi:hypothetical protein FHQ08_01395 [Lactobacillus sp. CC-MHH1034]|nr:hypothetical protein [Agrilactobacillus fermenti]MCD2255365.1 hypothetical protein [Agrilactobacillus fermenti]
MGRIYLIFMCARLLFFGRFWGMSLAAGRQVTTYLPNQPAVFLTGMRLAFAVSMVLCLAADLISIWRLVVSRKLRIDC